MKNSDGFLDVKDLRMTVLGLGFKPINSELDVCFSNFINEKSLSLQQSVIL